MPHMKNRFPRKLWMVVGLFLGVFAVAYLTQMLFHGGTQIDLIELSPAVTSSCPGRFCTAVCPAGYYAFSGSCSSPAGWQWNLVGVATDFQSWDCFDSSLLNKANIIPPPEQKAVVSCVKVGDWVALPDVPFRGNYKIEAGEVCDKNNTGDLDCTDFSVFDSDSGTLVPLCNGYLTCDNSGNAYDISHCTYCNSSGSSSNIPFGNGNACQSGSCLCTSPPCSPPGNGACGDGTVNLGEQCDGQFGCDDGPGGTCQWSAPGGICGDGYQDPSESCDPPGSTALGGLTVCCNGPFGLYCLNSELSCTSSCNWSETIPGCGPIGGPGSIDPGPPGV